MHPFRSPFRSPDGWFPAMAMDPARLALGDLGGLPRSVRATGRGHAIPKHLELQLGSHGDPKHVPIEIWAIICIYIYICIYKYIMDIVSCYFHELFILKELY